MRKILSLGMSVKNVGRSLCKHAGSDGGVSFRIMTTKELLLYSGEINLDRYAVEWENRVKFNFRKFVAGIKELLDEGDDIKKKLSKEGLECVDIRFFPVGFLIRRKNTHTNQEKDYKQDYCTYFNGYLTKLGDLLGFRRVPNEKKVEVFTRFLNSECADERLDPRVNYILLYGFYFMLKKYDLDIKRYININNLAGSGILERVKVSRAHKDNKHYATVGFEGVSHNVCLSSVIDEGGGMECYESMLDKGTVVLKSKMGSRRKVLRVFAEKWMGDIAKRYKCDGLLAPSRVGIDSEGEIWVLVKRGIPLSLSDRNEEQEVESFGKNMGSLLGALKFYENNLIQHGDIHEKNIVTFNSVWRFIDLETVHWMDSEYSKLGVKSAYDIGKSYKTEGGKEIKCEDVSPDRFQLAITLLKLGRETSFITREQDTDTRRYSIDVDGLAKKIDESSKCLEFLYRKQSARKNEFFIEINKNLYLLLASCLLNNCYDLTYIEEYLQKIVQAMEVWVDFARDIK